MFESDENRTEKDVIEGYLDERKQVIYLHAYTMLDTKCFLDNFEELFKKHEEQDPSANFLSVYEDIKNSVSKVFFILLYISHIVVLNHRTCDFDINYIQYFKVLDMLRHRVNWKINQVLRDAGILNPEWVATGRLCIPRLIFYFEQKPRNVPNLKKLEHNMEDRIYRILRRADIVNNATSLFSIPLNQEFVYISEDPDIDHLSYSVTRLMQACQPANLLTTGAPMSTPAPLKAPFCSDTNTPRSFDRFLDVHIQHARVTGFDDVASSTSRDVSRHNTHFEIPTLSQWANASKAIYTLVMDVDRITPLNTDTRFSERRCEKIYPIAFARYQEGLPSHYTKVVHENQLKIALNFFASQARGIKYQECYDKLMAECNDYWKAGRQLCEYPSLTQNPCTLPKHEDEKEHFSGAQYIAACNCGRTQRARDDPYSTKTANNIFYDNVSKECRCLTLRRIHFPVIKSINTSRSDRRRLDRTSTSQPILQDEARALAPTPTTSTGSLPPMLMSSSPADFRPEYSSWSLICLGPSSIYCHKIGLRESLQPGFISSTNFLLPWDVSIYNEPEQKSDTLRISSHHGRIGTISKRVPQFTVKVFFGIEYECPRGNRFMLATPHRVLRSSQGAILKEAAKLVADSDMPLYFPCPCKPAKPLTAQLMRIHVVTPKAPVIVSINPRVQPVAGGPVFTCRNECPISLPQSTYWILRLPFIYTSDKQSYPENHTGRLLHGLLSVQKAD